MRKVEKQIIEAIYSGKYFSGGNTTVTHNSNDFVVQLYGTKIVQRVDGKYYLSHGGYVTATTASRIHAITSTIGIGGVGIRKGVMSLSGPYATEIEQSPKVICDLSNIPL